jgi:hypothetical protein
MANFVQQVYTLSIYGDGVSTTASFDLAKTPFVGGFVNGGQGPLSIGNPNSVVSLGWQKTPQIGIDVNNNAIFDMPNITVALQGVSTLNLTFSSALKLSCSFFNDGQGNQWPIGSYVVNVAFRYNG